MKKSDIITATFIAIIGFIASFLIVQFIVGNPDEQAIKVTTIDVVSKDIADPSSDTFNSEALNPTVEVFVGDKNKKTDETKTQDSGNSTDQNKQTGN